VLAVKVAMEDVVPQLENVLEGRSVLVQAESMKIVIKKNAL
jgi:hypothetical protein